jgi:hypothetical protein
VRLLAASEPDEALENDILPQSQRVVLPAEFVPPQYWQSTPPELLNRLQKLNNERDSRKPLYDCAGRGFIS